MRKTSGVSLMLLIFLSLCLIIFSLLSLSGAVADETLSSQAAERTTEYYAAVTSANEILAQIDAQLGEYLREAESSESTQTADTKDPSGDTTDQKEDAYRQLCGGIGEDVPGVSREEDDVLAFSVEVDDDQILQVRLDAPYPASDSDALYQIRTWKIVNTSDWNADNSMHLFRSKDLS